VDTIRAWIAEVMPTVLAQTEQAADAFVWKHITSIEHLRSLRLAAMGEFLADYAKPGAEQRYHPGSLPVLRYADGEFDLSLCSHFLFLYAEHHSLDFHVSSVLELCRVARDARIFPLLELGGGESRHLRPAMEQLARRGLSAEVQRVSYEFQRGGNQMLVVRRSR
jgi:hypothetical protein